MNGHASIDDIKLVKLLESALDLGEGTIDELLELGQLYIEPCHREAEAISLFEAVLKRDPGNDCAKFWLAHCCYHYLMDQDSLRRAVALLQSVTVMDRQYASASYLLLAEVLEAQANLSVDKKIQLLETSVSLEPDWVYNRQNLAWAYMDAGRFLDAFEQIKQALVNVRIPESEWSVTKRNFEESITGRIGHRVIERLTSDLEKIKEKQTLYGRMDQ